MGFAKKCDRCGKLYELYNLESDPKNINGLLTLNIDYKRSYYTQNLIDLCPECMNSFDKWLKEKGNEIFSKI